MRANGELRDLGHNLQTGRDKSFPCQALGNAPCRKLIWIHYNHKLAGICEDLNRAHAAGNDSYHELVDKLETIPPLIADDLMTTPIATQNALDLSEIMKAHGELCAPSIASQLEPNG